MVAEEEIEGKRNKSSSNIDGVASEHIFLPKNNNKYLWQLIYLVFAIFILLPKTQFTFQTIFMFVIPILLDVVSMEAPTFPLQIFRSCSLAFNIIVTLFCMLGFFGIISYGESYFITSSDLIVLNDFKINKMIIFYMLLFDLLFPVIQYFSAPCQEKDQLLKAYEKSIKKQK